MCQLQKQLPSSSLIYWTKGPGDLRFKQLTDLENTSHLLYHQLFQLLVDVTIIIIIYYYYNGNNACVQKEYLTSAVCTVQVRKYKIILMSNDECLRNLIYSTFVFVFHE